MTKLYVHPWDHVHVPAIDTALFAHCKMEWIIEIPQTVECLSLYLVLDDNLFPCSFPTLNDDS